MLMFSNQTYPELPGIFLLLLAVRLLIDAGLGPRGMALAASSAALLPWVHLRFAFLTAAVVGALLVRSLRDGNARARGFRGWASAALPALGPLAVSAAALAVANQHWYGSPWLTAPWRLAKPPPHVEADWGYSHAVGGIFQPVFGWLPVAPVHVLAFVGLVYFCWRRRTWALAATAISLVYLLVILSARGAEGGFAFPARLQLVLIPLAAIPFLLLVKEVRPFALLAVPLAALTLAMSVAGASDIIGLLYPRSPNTPGVGLARALAPVWPATLGRKGGPDYPDWPKLVAWVGAIVAAGSIPAFLSRQRPLPDARSRLVRDSA
jgi:hypothetical protein